MYFVSLFIGGGSRKGDAYVFQSKVQVVDAFVSKILSREPGVRSQESGAGSQEPGAGSQEPGAGSREPGVRSREPGAGSQESGAGSNKKAALWRLFLFLLYKFRISYRENKPAKFLLILSGVL
jgi:hypothetical protein